MKQTLNVLFLSIAMLVAFSASAQKALTTAPTGLKFGHIDSNQLLSIMPERAKAKTDLETYAKKLEKELTTMQSEIERKYQDYVATADSLSPLMRQAKEKELTEMQQRFQQFQQAAQEDLGNKENELLQPIIDKARKAISDVGTEQGYIYIFDSGTGVLLHFSADSEDVLPLVKAKLGIL